MPPTRGALIVVEGLDRAGKSTQVALLVERLRSELGVQVEGLKFPDRTTPIGQNLNAYLTSSAGPALPLAAAHLLFSANRWEAAPSLLAKLRAGTTLVVDRYSYSGAVYTAAKASLDADTVHGSLAWPWAPEIGLPAPDALIFLDISPAAAAARGGFGDERYETTAMQARVRELFAELLGRVDTRVLRVDAGAAVEQVAAGVWEAAKGAWEGREEAIGVLGELR